MSTGLDTPIRITAKTKLVGIDFVARYYGYSPWKRLTAGEAIVIKAKGIPIVSVFEGNPVDVQYFTRNQGAQDAAMALEQAKACGQPTGTPIYFTVDYDACQSDLPRILAYAAAVNEVIKADGLLCGWYGSGLVLETIQNAGEGSYFWLAQSKGFADYQQYLATGKADIDQGAAGTIDGIVADPDTANVRAGGWVTTLSG